MSCCKIMMNKMEYGENFYKERSVFMFVKSFLVIGALFPCLLNGMEEKHEDVPPGFSEFLSDCDKLVRSVREETQIHSDFQDRWRAIKCNLTSEVCQSCVIDYSGTPEDIKTEITGLIEKKSKNLEENISQFFIDLYDSLKSRRDLQRRKWFPSRRDKDEISSLDRMLADSVRLNSFLDGIKLGGIVEGCFRRAHADGRLRGSEKWQDWFAFKRRNEGYFSRSLINSFNNRLQELGPEVFHANSHLDADTMQEVSKWETQFDAMRALTFPTSVLPQSLKDAEQLAGYLEGLSEPSRSSVASRWVSSFKKPLRCKFFIPAVPVGKIEDFFAASGCTSYTRSIESLLECENVESLEEALWGAPIESKNTPKGLILNALLALTRDNPRQSYQNATLIITNLEELIEVSNPEGKYTNDHKEYVVKIWDFLKFITADEFGEEGRLFRFPYLGIDNRTQDAEVVDLKRFNVVLHTPTKSFLEICRGVKPIVGGRSALALERRLTLEARPRDVQVNTQEEENIRKEIIASNSVNEEEEDE